MYFAPLAGAVSGVLTLFSLTGYRSSGEYVSVSPITIKDSNNLADYLVVVSTGGDVLAFTGDYPGSANWQLIVKTKIPGVKSPAKVYLIPHAGDAWLSVQYPAMLLSAKKLIQEGLLIAEQEGPLAKQISFIREASGGRIDQVAVVGGKNALVVQTMFNAEINNLLYGFTAVTQDSNWLYIDLVSGAVSPFTYPDNSLPYNAFFIGGTIGHSDGSVYTLYYNPPDATKTLYKLFNNAVSTTEEDANTFLQFPYSNLGYADTIKTASMVYPMMSRSGGYVEAKLAIDYDYDKANAQVFDSATGAAYTGIESKRLVVPTAGQGDSMSVAIINKRRQRLSCENMGIQFEPGGPY